MIWFFLELRVSSHSPMGSQPAGKSPVIMAKSSIFGVRVLEFCRTFKRYHYPLVIEHNYWTSPFFICKSPEGTSDDGMNWMNCPFELKFTTSKHRTVAWRIMEFKHAMHDELPVKQCKARKEEEEEEEGITLWHEHHEHHEFGEIQYDATKFPSKKSTCFPDGGL